MNTSEGGLDSASVRVAIFLSSQTPDQVGDDLEVNLVIAFFVAVIFRN